MEQSDLIKLHQEREICFICGGKFYGKEYLTFVETCKQPHVLHQRCFLRSVYKSKDKKNLSCGYCRTKWQHDDIVVVKMPSDLPCRWDGGDSPPEGFPPAPPPRPLAPLELKPGEDPPDGTLPNWDITFCTKCGEFLKPGDWRLAEPPSVSYSKVHPYEVYCVLCLLSFIEGFPTEPSEPEGTPEYTDEDYRDEDGGAEEYYTDDDGSYGHQHWGVQYSDEDRGESGEYREEEENVDYDETEKVDEEMFNGNDEIEENNSGTEYDAEEREDVRSDRTEGEDQDKSED